MWTLFPMNPVMRRLGWGVFLLLWPLNLGDGQWMTLVTGLAGGFLLLLLALWRLRDAGGYFRRAFFWLLPVLLLQAGGLAASYYLEAVSYTHLLHKRNSDRSLLNPASP